jgi:hypothetical protein
MEVTEQSFAAANRRGDKVKAALPAAVSVRYDRRSARLVISLSSGVDISFSPKLVQGLEAAKPADLTDAQISPSGLGVHFPKLNLADQLRNAYFAACKANQLEVLEDDAE